MNIEYKNINKNDIHKVIKLWNNNIGSLFPMDEQLFSENLNMDENFKYDNVIGAFWGEKLLGFIIFKQQLSNKGLIDADNTRGNINSIIVDYLWRKKGIGSMLLNMCEEKLKASGVKHIEIGRDTFHFFPGIPVEFKKGFEFFKVKEYKEEYASWDLIADISNVEIDEAVKSRNLKLNTEDKYVIEELREEDKGMLMDFLSKTFPGRWYGDTDIFFKYGMKCRDIVIVKDCAENIIIGFSHIYDKNSDIIGPGIYWRTLLGESFGGLGPIGIDKDYRKKDLGLTLLYKSLYILKKRGVKQMCIDWTDLFDFYGVFNFIPWKGYVHMGKELSK